MKDVRDPKDSTIHGNGDDTSFCRNTKELPELPGIGRSMKHTVRATSSYRQYCASVADSVRPPETCGFEEAERYRTNNQGVFLLKFPLEHRTTLTGDRHTKYHRGRDRTGRAARSARIFFLPGISGPILKYV